MPDQLAGMRTDPPWSQPIASSMSPHAIAAALPLEEPPEEKPRADGFCTGTFEVWLCPEKLKFSQAVFPTIRK